MDADMSQLRKLQNTFQSSVLEPDIENELGWVSASGRATPDTQLAIYGHAYRARLKEVLANDYPATLIAIGEDQFNQIADDYIHLHPSHYFSLRDFGVHMPTFIENLITQNTSYKGMHWLHELALFEWTLGDAFDAADVEIVSEQELTNIPPEDWADLRFVLHPSVQCLELEWNIPAMWQALTADVPAQVTAIHEDASPWLIWRQQLVTRFRSMQRDEQLALEAVRKGQDFNTVCEVLTKLVEEEQVPAHAAGLLKGWIAQGLISGVQLEQ